MAQKVLVWRSKKAWDSEDTWTSERDVVINGVPQDHIQRLYILYLIPPSTLLT